MVHQEANSLEQEGQGVVLDLEFVRPAFFEEQ
jgi:hypothetical protein